MSPQARHTVAARAGRVGTPLAFVALFVAGLSATCSDDPSAPTTSATLWLTPNESVCVEPAVAVDAIGRTFGAWLEFGAAAAPRLVAGFLEGSFVAVDDDLELPAAPALVAFEDGAYLAFEAVRRASSGVLERGIFGRTLAPRAEGGVELGPLECIAEGRALLPALAAPGGGALEVVHQALVGESYDLVWRRREPDGTWSGARSIAAGAEDVWRPRVASAGDGRVSVVYDAFDGESFDVRYLELERGTATLAIDVAFGPAYQGLPDVALDRAGRAWIAWEEAPQFGETGGLRAERTLALACIESGRVRRAEIEPVRADFPRLACGERGLVVTGRAPGATWPPAGAEQYAAFYAAWFTNAIAFGSSGEVRSTRLVDTDGDNDGTEVLLAAQADGSVSCFFSADLRTRRRPKPGAFQEPLEGRWRVGRIELSAPTAFPPLAAEADGASSRVTSGTTEAGPMARNAEEGPRPFFGDLHRHTQLSRCQGSMDGTRLDAYRYARGPGGLDFVSINDHYQHLTPWSWWSSLRDVERFHAPGSLVTFAGIERALRTRAHVNEVYLDPSEVPLDIPVFHRAPAEPGAIPAEHTLAIPHMMGMEGAPFPWEEFAPDFHRLVEVYQGLRGSFEGPGLPYEAQNRAFDDSSLANGIARGLHFGLIASSDHRASSTAYAGVQADELSREAIFAALRARRAFAASDRVALDARVGRLRMGEAGTAAADAPFELAVRARGASVATVELVKNGATVARRDGGSARELVVVSSWSYRPDGPGESLALRAEGASIVGARLRQRGLSAARLSFGGGVARVARGIAFVDVVLELERDSSAGSFALELALELAHEGADASERVDLAALAPGRATRGLERFPSESVWRLGSPLGDAPRPVDAAGSALGDARAFRFEDPERAPGDAYYARVAFTDGNVAWTSPIRVLAFE